MGLLNLLWHRPSICRSTLEFRMSRWLNRLQNKWAGHNHLVAAAKMSFLPSADDDISSFKVYRKSHKSLPQRTGKMSFLPLPVNRQLRCDISMGKVHHKSQENLPQRLPETLAASLPLTRPPSLPWKRIIGGIDGGNWTLASGETFCILGRMCSAKNAGLGTRPGWPRDTAGGQCDGYIRAHTVWIQRRYNATSFVMNTWNLSVYNTK